MAAVLGNTGYLVGIGIEVFVILICGAMLALMLTGLLFKWQEESKRTRVVKAEARAASSEAWAIIEEERAAQAAAEAEAERARTEAEAKVRAAAEAAAAEAAAVAAAKKADEEAKRAEEEARNKPKLQPKLQPKQEVAEEEPVEVVEPAAGTEVVRERIVEKVVIVEQQKAAQPAPAAAPAQVYAEAAAAEEEEEEDAEAENEFVVVHDGIVFNDSKTITEQYEELSPEQQSYFDELREEALTKPDAELAIAKNFVSVKIGKRNLIKLLIKRGVTVAEFMLENDALKALRLSNTNKRGKSAIKIKPTVVQVLDLNSLKVAVDMINLAYEELMLGD